MFLFSIVHKLAQHDPDNTEIFTVFGCSRSSICFEEITSLVNKYFSTTSLTSQIKLFMSNEVLEYTANGFVENGIFVNSIF